MTQRFLMTMTKNLAFQLIRARSRRSAHAPRRVRPMMVSAPIRVRQ